MIDYYNALKSSQTVKTLDENHLEFYVSDHFLMPVTDLIFEYNFSYNQL